MVYSNISMSEFPQRILHIDDDPAICDIVETSLGDLDGVTFHSSQDAKDIVSQVNDFAPDLLLLDLIMPGYNGPDAMQDLLREGGLNKVPVIFITSCTNVKMDETLKRLQVIGVIHKPFSPGMLPERIRYLWHLYNGGEELEIESPFQQ